ncbi:N/A [soil metagenome]
MRVLLPLLIAAVAACLPAATTGDEPPASSPQRADAAVQGPQGEAAIHDLRRRLFERARSAPGEVSVALVDLESGAAIGIADDVVMHAASTMKVPVLLELFRQAAEGRFALADSVRVRNEFTSIADGSRYALSEEDDSEHELYRLIGRRLSRMELARRMIARSSNLATNLLIEEVDAASVRRTMRELGAAETVVLRGVEDIPAYERGMNNTTTARALARVFAALARCERSEPIPALEPLTASDCRRITAVLQEQEFRDRIPAGLPAGIRVANKTGWISGIAHDAAIVYPPCRAPYVLVVLTRGISEDSTSIAVARDLSAIAWAGLTGR